MRRLAGKARAALLASGVLACACAGAWAPSQAGAEIPFAPCERSNDFACAHLAVPLDPSGATPGTVTLALRRHRAAVGEARTAIIALAGGPGQPALPFLEQFEELLGPIAATRDLIVFDQRGIGLSEALSCHAFEHPGSYRSRGALVAACGEELGARRAFYTTADSVADIEAIRAAGGYEKLVLYGTSYGTKLAEEYAQAHPSRVEALVLDSVVEPAGPEPLNRPTFAAIPRVLRQLCAHQACQHITANPVADLDRVVTRLNRTAVRARVIAVDGTAQTIRLTAEELFEVLLAGDFSPLVRGEVPTALAAAGRGDEAPLARLVNIASDAEEEAEAEEDFDNPDFYATSCEEQALPFSRTASPSERMAEARTATRALGPTAFAPFTAANALQTSLTGECADWPYSTPAPPAQDAPLPAVPTLILSGAEDLRTPSAGALQLAAQIPGADVLIVPHTGHSVLSSETGSCASDALQALFAKRAIEQCRPTPAPAALRPPPLPPERLSLVSPQHGYEGLAGRSLHAVALTLEDLDRALALRLTVSGGEGASSGGLRVGGLRAGWAGLGSEAIDLHAYSFVPGVTVSGAISAEGTRLSVQAPAGAGGSLKLRHRALVGTLDGSSVVLPANAVSATAIVASDGQQSSHRALRGSARRRLARVLAELLGRL